jgi:hypothetical protein
MLGYGLGTADQLSPDLTPFRRLTRVATPAPIHLHLGIIGILDDGCCCLGLQYR